MAFVGDPSGKDRLRASMKRQRAEVSAHERSAIDTAITQRVSELPEFKDAHIIATYLSFASEVETRGVIERAWRAGKAVALPRIVPASRRMRWFAVASLDSLERSAFGMDEPFDDLTCELDLSGRSDVLALVPGLAFDVSGFRLGYGGGFYDTFLSSFSGVSLGLCREAQLVDSLAELAAVDTHDRPVSLMVTEERVIRLDSCSASPSMNTPER